MNDLHTLINDCKRNWDSADTSAVEPAALVREHLGRIATKWNTENQSFPISDELLDALVVAVTFPAPPNFIADPEPISVFTRICVALQRVLGCLTILFVFRLLALPLFPGYPASPGFWRVGLLLFFVVSPTLIAYDLSGLRDRHERDFHAAKVRREEATRRLFERAASVLVSIASQHHQIISATQDDEPQTA